MTEATPTTGGALDGADEYAGTLGRASRSGDKLATLMELRDWLADQMDKSNDARASAALSRQLTDVLDRIEAAGGSAKGKSSTPLDELGSLRRKKQA